MSGSQRITAKCKGCGASKEFVASKGFRLARQPCPGCGKAGTLRCDAGLPKATCGACGESSGIFVPAGSKLRRMPCPKCGATKLSGPVQKQPKKAGKSSGDASPDWSGSCSNCGESPIVPATGLCGPCTFGEAATAGGNW